MNEFKKEVLETYLNDSELKSLFTTENTKDLSDDGIVGEIKILKKLLLRVIN